MSNRHNEIIVKLIDKYFDTPDTSGQTSSHWKHFHAKTNYRTIEGTIELEGAGFGYTPKVGYIFRFFDLLGQLLTILWCNNRLKIIKNLPKGISIAKRMGHPFTKDCLRALYTYINFIQDRNYSSITIIGDGWGFLSGIIHSYDPHTHLTLIDLGKTMTFQYATLSKAFPNAKIRVLDEENTDDDIAKRDNIELCPADKYLGLASRYNDLIINIHSMQEMDKSTINEYFKYIRLALKEGGLFYCCNRVSKKLPCGTTIRLYDYPWMPKDTVLLDEECPWVTFFVSTWRAKRGPRIFGRRIPFINYYDGPIRHRLVKMHTTEQ